MKALIDQYQLTPHPEGGYYKEIYRSAQSVTSPVTGEERQAVTQIYFLLTRGEVSRFHRVVHDEIWHFYQGSPLALIQYDGEKVTRQVIGPETGYTAVVPGGVWQAAESCGDYTLVGCTVAPGFDFKDFTFLSDQPAQAEFMQAHHPYHRFL